MKKIFAFVLMAVLVLSLSAAAFAAPAYNVGVCQLVQHPALDAATEGFMDALKEKLGEDAVKFSVQNASGDSATCAVICNQFVSDEVDLILANATPALLAAQSSTNKIPILGTSVTDYASALDIDDWNGATGTNISGTSDGVPAQAQAEVSFTAPASPTPSSRLMRSVRSSKRWATRSRTTPLPIPTTLLRSLPMPAMTATCSTSRPTTPLPPMPN